MLCCVLLCAFVGQYIEYTKMHGVSNIKVITDNNNNNNNNNNTGKVHPRTGHEGPPGE